MCVIGNPPYNPSSQNNSPWIRDQVSIYKEGLNERKINLDDDYIKFLRLAEIFVEKNGSGVVGMITNNSFLTGVTHRRMRQHLLETFNSIYVLDLHGDSNKLETAPDGSKDENIFDIQQGVSIIILIKTNNDKKITDVYHIDSHGKRDSKNDLLWSLNNTCSKWAKIIPTTPYYFFDQRSSKGEKKYSRGIKVTEFFLNYNTGIQTKRDALCLQGTLDAINSIKDDLFELDTEAFRSKHNLVKDNRDWSIKGARTDLEINKPIPIRILHRPFDIKYTFFTGKSKGFLGYPREKTMRHMLIGDNIALLFGRQNKSGENNDILVTNLMSEMKSAERTIQSYQAPLYLYPDEQDLDQSRRINFDPKLWKQLQAKAKHPKLGMPDEVQTFDYIYGVLHYPTYRDTYKEFLKIDFPRIPWPSTPDEFWDVSAKGKSLRELHLMQDAAIGDTPYRLKGAGDNRVVKPEYKDGQVWINADQHFDAVPNVSWDFYIGGYQPAQKWLKDRKGLKLGFDDIMHYQKVLKILAETDRIMQTIKMDL